MSTDRRTGDLYCDFCGKSQHEVDTLIRGPSVEICDECIPLAQQRVDESRAARAGGARQVPETTGSLATSKAQGSALPSSPVASDRTTANSPVVAGPSLETQP